MTSVGPTCEGACRTALAPRGRGRPQRWSLHGWGEGGRGASAGPHPFLLLIGCERPSPGTGEGRATGAQYTTTLRMVLPSCIRSKPLLISSSGMVWVIIGSISILPSMYQSTIFGTSVRPRAPPKAVPFQTRPVTSWNGRVAISLPAPATPMMTDLAPAAMAALRAPGASRSTLPMQSKV